MVSGAGSGGVDRVGGVRHADLVRLARARAPHRGCPAAGTTVRARASWSGCGARRRCAAGRTAGARPGGGRLPPGPESSIGKVHAADLNQRIQAAAAELLGVGGMAWAGNAEAAYADPAATGPTCQPRCAGMLRSRANTIEGGTTEVNKNVLAERVLGMPKEPDPWRASRGATFPVAESGVATGNSKVYIHEFIDIIGHNRANYMHHMTANFSPTAQEERNQLCYGVWGVVGIDQDGGPRSSTCGRRTASTAWPARSATSSATPACRTRSWPSGGPRRPSLRSGGFDRVLVPAPLDPDHRGAVRRRHRRGDLCPRT